MQRSIFNVSNSLILFFFMMATGTPRAEVVTGDKPTTYSTPNQSSIQSLNDAYRRRLITSEEYQDGLAKLERGVTVDPQSALSPAQIPSPESAPKTTVQRMPPVQIDDQTGMVTDSIQKLIQSYLRLFPTTQILGLNKIAFDNKPTSFQNDSFDATAGTITLHLVRGEDAREIILDVGTAIGYYYYQYLMDAQTKADWNKAAGPFSADVLSRSFALEYETWAANFTPAGDFALTLSAANSFRSSDLVARSLLRIALFRVPKENSAYTYLVNKDGSVKRGTIAAYVDGNTIVADHYRFYLTADLKITGYSEVSQHQPTALFTNGSSTVLPEVLTLLAPASGKSGSGRAQ